MRKKYRQTTHKIYEHATYTWGILGIDVKISVRRQIKYTNT